MGTPASGAARATMSRRRGHARGEWRERITRKERRKGAGKYRTRGETRKGEHTRRDRRGVPTSIELKKKDNGAGPSEKRTPPHPATTV
eukprot:scaffold54964_cov30-Tisochrysis_lutea.AAC.6